VVRGLRDALDATDVRLTMLENRDDLLAGALAELGEPVRRAELLRVHEPVRRRRGLLRRRQVLLPEVVAGPRLQPDQLPARVDLFVPVLHEQHCVAYVALGEKVYGLAYGAEELGLLSVLSTQIGAALLNIRLLKESVERKSSKRSSYRAPDPDEDAPGPAAGGARVRVVWLSRFQPAGGGDYYDFIMVDDRWLVVVGATFPERAFPRHCSPRRCRPRCATGADAQNRSTGCSHASTG
jgi:hypothetical protein